KTIQCSKYKETCEELERELRADKDTIERILKEKDKIQSDFFKIENEKIIIQHETQLAKKAFKERENRYLEDIVDLEEKLSSHDRIVYKMGQSIQTIHMLGKTPNKVYDPFLKAGLGYKNPKRLEKAIAAQPKMYDSEKLHSTKLVIDSPDSDETLEDSEESSIENEKQNEQTYFSIPSTSTNGSESKAVTSKLSIPKMPKESKLLKMFDTLELKEELIEEKHELLKDEPVKSSSDSKDIQANLLKRIKILENDFKRSQAQSIDFKLKLLHQKEKMACDVSWKSKLSTLNDENVVLKTQVESIVQERENVKLEYQKLFNSIKATRTQHKKELDELIEHVNQKTYAYADVRAQNQDLLITISELKNRLKTVDKGKNVNTKFDKSEASGTLLCVTPLSKNIAIKAKCVESSNIVRRQKSKDTKSKNRVLKNTNAKSSTTHCVARYALSRNSNVKRSLFTTPVAAKSKNLRTTSVVAKSRLSVANTPKATNKVFSASSLSHDSSQSKTLSNYMKNKIATSQKWQRWFEYQQKFNWSPKSKIAQSFRVKQRVVIQLEQSALGNDHFAAITGYGDYVQGNLTICHIYYVEGLEHNLFSAGQFYDGDLEVDFRSNTCYVRNLEGDDLLIGSRDSNLYTITIFEMAVSSPIHQKNSQSIPSKSDLDNLFGPMYEEFYATSSQEVSDNSAANTLESKHTSSSSSIVIEEDEASQIVSSSAEQVATEPNSLVLNANANEFVQKDVADFYGNMFYNAPLTPMFEEAESSSTYQDPSNMHEFHQKHRSINSWTKNHPIKQVNVSTIEPKNIKEAMLDASCIESMQDELNQFKHLNVWELVECPIGRNIIAVK
ncbi:hypothetical protein Tco_0686467, partial [Tanacetum coccineum]